jgi:hypothetical protein
VSQSYYRLSQSVPVHLGGGNVAVHFNRFIRGRSQVIYSYGTVNLQVEKCQGGIKVESDVMFPLIGVANSVGRVSLQCIFYVLGTSAQN